MSNILDLINKNNFEKKERINLLKNIKTHKLYENGEYEKYIEVLTQQIENDNYIDIYSFFLALNSEIILNIEDNSIIANKIAEYANLLTDSFDKLSPTNFEQRSQSSTHGLDAFIDFLNINLSNIYKEKPGKIKIQENTIESIEKIFSMYDDLELAYNKEEKTKLLQLLKRIHKDEQAKINNESIENSNVKEQKQITDNKASLVGRPSQKIGSSKWDELLNKMEILKGLVDEDRLFETAIVYEDVKNLLAKFDPKEYFPEVFFPFYKKVAPEAGKIHKSIDSYSKTVQWKIAKELYQIDYNSFLNDCDRMAENDIIETTKAKAHFYESKSQFNQQAEKHKAHEQEFLNEGEEEDYEDEDEDYEDEDYEDEEYEDEEYEDEEYEDE